MARRALIVLALLGAASLAAAGAVHWFLSSDAIRRALEQQASTWLGQPVQLGSAGARLFPRIGLELRDVRVGNPARLTLQRVDVSTGLRALFSRRVADAEVTVADSHVQMPLAFSLPASGGSAGAAEQPSFTVESIRAIELRDIRITSRGRDLVVSAEAAVAGTQLKLERFTATSGRTSVHASGVVTISPSLDARLEVAADELDLDDLMALATAFAPAGASRQPRGAGSVVPGRVVARIKAARGTAAGLALADLDAQIVAEASGVTLSPIAFNVLGGRYDGALEMSTGDRLAVSMAPRVDAIDVAQLASFGGIPGAITGRLSGSGRFNGRGADFASVLAAAAGQGNVSITDGTIKGLDLVRTVILFFGRPAADAPTASGERFDRVSASFSLARQVIRTDSLEMRSPDFDLAATGTLTIPTKALKGRATIRLSEGLSAQAGRDLVRYAREGNRVVLPATIAGTLDRPRVMIDAAAALKRGLQNEVERRLKGLLDRLQPPQRDR